MRVLVVEDYAPLRHALQQGLTECGFAVDVSADGREGLWYAQSGEHDVIVLDIMLPQMDGLEVLRSLRKAGIASPVLMLTARDTIIDRVAGLDSGADDYLVKPFAFEELTARVRALARRRYEKPNPVLTVGDLEINTATRLVHRAGEPIELTPREYVLLEFLAFRSGEVVSRDEIREKMYAFDRESESNIVDVYVGYLRRKLERDGQSRLIHTRRGLGYLLGSE